MASPRYAEKQAIQWLDAVRYADTAGFHGDNPYSGLAVPRLGAERAFATTSRSTSSRASSSPAICCRMRPTISGSPPAYNRLNRVSGEGGLQEKEYLAKYGADRVRTVSTVWMGSTLGCAECHDHKFDPFKAKDFYAMKAFFADINETGMARDGNGRNGPEAWGVKLQLPTPEREAPARGSRSPDCGGAEARSRTGPRRSASSASSGRATTLERFKRGELTWRFQRPVVGVAAGRDADRSRRSRRPRRQPAAVQRKTGHRPDRGRRRESRHRDVHHHAASRARARGDRSASKSRGTIRCRARFVARGGIGAEVSEIEAEPVRRAGAGCRSSIAASAARVSATSRPAAGRAPSTAISRRRGASAISATSASNPFAAFQFAEPVTTTVRHDDRDPAPPAVAGAACDARTLPPRAVGGRPRGPTTRSRAARWQTTRSTSRRSTGVFLLASCRRCGARRRSDACRRAR